MIDVNVERSAEAKISIALSVAIVVQTATALIWAGAAGERIEQLERRADMSEQIIVRTARLEEQMLYLRVTLDRIEEKIVLKNSTTN